MISPAGQDNGVPSPDRLTFDFNSTAVSPATRAVFEQDVRHIFEAMETIRVRHKIPQYRATIILSDDLAADINRRDPFAESFQDQGFEIVPFTVERLGGLVAGKNLRLRGDAAEIAIVFDSQFWRDAATDSVNRAKGIALIAHELAHPLITRSLHEAPIHLAYPPYTRAEVTRFVSLSLFEEYHADKLSDILLGITTSVNDQDETRKARSWDLFGPDTEATLAEVLSGAYPALPDLTTKYLLRELDLSDMFRQVNEMVLGIFMTLIHAQTSADTVNRDNILKDEPFASLPAVRLYFQKEWTQLLEALDDAPLAPGPDSIADPVQHAFAAGDSLLTSIWSQLGLDPEDLEDGSIYLHFYEPVYLAD